MLNQEYPDTRWTLVLPPWGHLYHWQTRELGAQVNRNLTLSGYSNENVIGLKLFGLAKAFGKGLLR